MSRKIDNEEMGVIFILIGIFFGLIFPLILDLLRYFY
jgi:hypothetical protein